MSTADAARIRPQIIPIGIAPAKQILDLFTDAREPSLRRAATQSDQPGRDTVGFAIRKRREIVLRECGAHAAQARMRRPRLVRRERRAGRQRHDDRDDARRT